MTQDILRVRKIIKRLQGDWMQGLTPHPLE
jgi:hypothetical protein